MLNKVKHSNMVSEITINYLNKVPIKDRVKISDSGTAVEVLRERFAPFVEHHEEFHVLLLNKANHVLCVHKVGQGGLDACMADVRCIFQAALLANASAIILCHNHPSGNLKASEADDRMTNNIKKAGELMQIKLFDHIILTADSYLSYADEGKIC
jgi:DNA repair protein RadC